MANVSGLSERGNRSVQTSGTWRKAQQMLVKTYPRRRLIGQTPPSIENETLLDFHFSLNRIRWALYEGAEFIESIVALQGQTMPANLKYCPQRHHVFFELEMISSPQ